MANVDPLQLKLAQLAEKAIEKCNWTPKQFFALVEEVGITITSFDGNKIFGEVTEIRLRQIEDELKAFPEGIPPIIEPECWPAEKLEELGLKVEQCVPTMLYQAIRKFAEDNGHTLRRLEVAHGAVANLRDKMSLEVLSELFDKVKTWLTEDEAKAEKLEQADAAYEKVFGEKPTEVAFDGPHVVETEVIEAPADGEEVEGFDHLFDKAEPCDVEECSEDAIYFVGSKRMRSCEQHLKHELFGKYRNKELISEARAQADEKAKAKEDEETRKLAEAEERITKFERLEVINRWTGDSTSLGWVAGRLRALEVELDDTKRVLGARQRLIEAEIAQIKETYGDSVLDILDKNLPRTKDGDFDKKYLTLSTVRLSGKQTGGKLKVIDGVALSEWLNSLPKEELPLNSISEDVIRVLDFDDVKLNYTASGGAVELPPGLEYEEVRALGAWDVTIPA
ncbi:MAG: hypothetical protein K2X93_00080 [Candidatus Obscuribacterales bacterium]|nr:hypothetical protein [Candidatus Obscuribacterales bacterium]